MLKPIGTVRRRRRARQGQPARERASRPARAHPRLRAAVHRHDPGGRHRVLPGPRRARGQPRAVHRLGGRDRRRARLRRAEPGQGLPDRPVHAARGPVRRRRRDRRRAGERHRRGGHAARSPRSATPTARSGTSPTAPCCASATRPRAGRPRSSRSTSTTSRTWTRSVAAREAAARVAADPVSARTAGQPTITGIEKLSADAVTLRLKVKTSPAKQWEVARELRIAPAHVLEPADVPLAGQRDLMARTGRTSAEAARRRRPAQHPLDDLAHAHERPPGVGRPASGPVEQRVARVHGRAVGHQDGEQLGRPAGRRRGRSSPARRRARPRATS